jgi:large subunit ribosomal protein L35
MPKLKTRKAAAKRLRVTGSGKIVRRQTHRSHLLEHKSASRRRRLAGVVVVSDRDVANAHLMLPYL